MIATYPLPYRFGQTGLANFKKIKIIIFILHNIKKMLYTWNIRCIQCTFIWNRKFWLKLIFHFLHQKLLIFTVMPLGRSSSFSAVYNQVDAYHATEKPFCMEVHCLHYKSSMLFYVLILLLSGFVLEKCVHSRALDLSRRCKFHRPISLACERY